MFEPLLVESSQSNLLIKIGHWLDFTNIAVRGDFPNSVMQVLL
jgi:hypothetical protein